MRYSNLFSSNTSEADSQASVPQLMWLMLVGFSVRIFVSQALLGGLDRAYEGDEGAYAQMALRLVQGLGFVDNSGNPTSYLSPGVPLLVAIPTVMFGPEPLGIRLFLCLLEALLIPACYLLGRSVTGSSRLGLIAATIAVFFPTWIIPSGAVMTDVPAAVFVVFTAWLLIEGHRRESLLWFSASGIVWGISIMVRGVTLSYLPAIVLWLLLVMHGWRMRLLAIAVTVIAAASIVAPWALRNSYVHGAFVLTSTQGGTELNKANNPEATGILAYDHLYFSDNLDGRYSREQYDEATRSTMYQADAIKFIRQNPGRFTELCFIRFSELWKLYSPRVPLVNSLGVIASFGVALPFFLIQIVRRGWHRGPEMLLLLIIVCHTAVHVVYTSIVRYRIPIEPLVILMALQAFQWVVSSSSAYKAQQSQSTNRIAQSFKF